MYDLSNALPVPRIRHKSGRMIQLDSWCGLSMPLKYAPYKECILEDIRDDIVCAALEYPRLLAIRFELQLPSLNDISGHYKRVLYKNGSISVGNFLKHLTAMVKADMCLDSRADRCLWFNAVLEQGGSSICPLYHCLLLVDRDTYPELGVIDPAQANAVNLATLMGKAWTAVLMVPYDRSAQLVRFCANSVFKLDTAPNELFPVIDEIFYNASLLAKVYSLEDCDDKERQIQSYGNSREI